MQFESLVAQSYVAHKPILKNGSFHANTRKVFGIAERSGSGKSTLVNLINSDGPVLPSKII